MALHLNNGGTTVNGILGLQRGKILSSDTHKLTLATVSTSDIKSPANVGGVQDMGTDSSYVVGIMGHISNSTSQMIFPIGSYPVYGPIALTPQGLLLKLIIAIMLVKVLVINY
jgi:hypothetical protein